jgi:hypothetical protein
VGAPLTPPSSCNICQQEDDQQQLIDEHGAALSLYKPLAAYLGGNSSRKQGGHMSDNLKLTKLLYYFWLPAGKDQFGFQHQERAPLSKTAFYRDTRPRRANYF